MLDAESVLVLGRCNLASTVSFGGAFQRALAFLFPPEVKPLSGKEIALVLEYQRRISRCGVDRNLAEYAGVQIVSVAEGCAPPKLERGTAASRTANRG